MTKDDTEIVSVLRAALADRVGNERFELWFGATTRIALVAGSLTISVPNRFFQEWIRTNFRAAIESACLEVLGNCPPMEFCVDPGLAEARLPVAPPVAGRADRPGTAAPPSPAGRSSSRPDLPPHGQQRRCDLESFVVGLTNRLAVSSAEIALHRPGQFTPLVIHGPTGVGKTHLLQGICTAWRKLHPSSRAIYLSAEQFTTGFIEALRGSGLPNFRRKCRGVELLVLDDLQFFSGKRVTQVELLHTIDALLREGRQLVFGADRPPSDLGEWVPELIARLNGGMVCRIEPPDYATRLGIIAHLAHQADIHLPQDVQEFVAARLTNHARELSGALCRLHASSQSLGRPVTLAMAEETLAEMIRHGNPVVRLPDIQKAVCDVLGVNAAELQSQCKAQQASYPRMLAMWLARKHTRAALSEIGQFFGRRSHSTVISAQKRIDTWMASGRSIHLADRQLTVDEAIRQVENRLRAC